MVVDKPIAVLLVVDVKLRIFPVIDDSAILSATVIFGNNFTPFFPKKEIIWTETTTLRHRCLKIQTLPFWFSPQLSHQNPWTWFLTITLNHLRLSLSCHRVAASNRVRGRSCRDVVGVSASSHYTTVEFTHSVKHKLAVTAQGASWFRFCLGS